MLDWLISATWPNRPDTEAAAPADALPAFCRAMADALQCDPAGTAGVRRLLASRDARLDPGALRSAGLRSLAPDTASADALEAVRARLLLSTANGGRGTSRSAG